MFTCRRKRDRQADRERVYTYQRKSETGGQKERVHLPEKERQADRKKVFTCRERERDRKTERECSLTRERDRRAERKYKIARERE